MSGPTINLNQIPNNPTLTDLLNLLKKEIFLDLSCHHIGTIQSFDSAKQTVTATVNYTKTFFELNSQTGLYDAVQRNYPVLLDCPAIVLGGGAASLTFPIAKGDECLLLFNDRDMDNWFLGSAVGPVASSRLHSFADAFALVGVRSLANVLSNYDSARVVLQLGTTMVGVGVTKVKIANGTTTLNTLLQNILTQVENVATACAAITVTGVTTGPGTSGPPANAAVFTAASLQLTMLAAQLGGLLE